MIELMNCGRDIVFTALFGGYEELNELKINLSSKTRYICFTDSKQVKSKTWEVVVVEPYDLNSSARSSRYVKMFGYSYFPRDTRSLYVDNSVEIKEDGKVILDNWLGSSAIAMLRHTDRKTVRGEFFACASYGLDDQNNLKTQFNFYKNNYSEILRERPYWGGMIARHNCPETDRIMSKWHELFSNFSKRDQLSINLASKISGVKIMEIPEKNSFSTFHKWPIINNRDYSSRDSTSGKKNRKLRIIFNGLFYGLRFYL